MKKSKKTTLLVFAALTAVAAYLTFENNAVTVTPYEFISEKVPAGFDGFKIVHLSDIHVKNPHKSYSLMIKSIDEQRPDIIVISGDLIDHRATDIPAAAALAKKLCGIAPVYYVTGNHEEALDTESYTQALSGLAQAGVTLLDSRTVFIQKNGGEIALSGAFDTPYSAGSTAEQLIEPELFNIFVYHRPHFGEDIALAGADLVLSGHAHGGQMQIPFVGGLIAPDQGFFPKYSEGMHSFGGSALVISRGIGNSLIPFRVNNRPEAVAVTLRQK